MNCENGLLCALGHGLVSVIMRNVNPINLIETVDNVTYDTASVPEPATIILFIMGLAGIGIVRGGWFGKARPVELTPV